MFVFCCCRLKPKAPPEFPTCDHSTGTFQCRTLCEKDLKIFHDAFYSSSTKVSQDSFILKFCSSIPIKRRRPKNSRYQGKQFTTKTFIQTANKKLIPVCQKTFLNTLQITASRLKCVINNFLKTGCSPKENRGGDKKSSKNQQKRASIVEFITKLRCLESHYCRGHSVRQYLPAELSIRKLTRMYNNEKSGDEKVKPWLFRHVFNNKFNLGFGSPRSDVCSKCLELAEKLKYCKIANEKTKLIHERRVHKLRAKAFYSLLKENDDHLAIFSFDCQKNQVLPKVPDQSAYYSRQLYIHNFTIVKGHSKSPLNHDNVYSYYWTEDEFAKDSNTIASAVYHCLKESDFTGKKTVRLVADGCGGQNKNSILLTMCMRWLTVAPINIENIEIIFPVVGHSFIPPDRVFGIMEREVKKIDTIVDPKDYVDIFSKTATVLRIGKDCHIYDWRKETEKYLKTTGNWHFKFSKCKRFYIKKTNSRPTAKILVRGEEYYKSDFCMEKSVFKRGKNIYMINPDLIMPGANVTVSNLKFIDVNKLLVKHFGVEWRNINSLGYYKNIIPQEIPNVVPTEEEVIGFNQYCNEHVEESPNLVV